MLRRALVLVLTLGVFVLPVLAEEEEGEGDRVERRREWFFESRRAGTVSAEQMARLRAVAARETHAAIEKLRLAKGKAAASSAAWVAKGPAPSQFGGWAFGSIAGRVAAIAVDPASATVYVGSASGGLWKSTDGGASYTDVFATAGTMTVGAVAIDPNDPQTIWAGTGENNQGCESYFGIGLLRSTDGGATWELRNGAGGSTLEDLSSFADVVVDPRDSKHVVTGGRIRGCSSGSEIAAGIYRTFDSGATWSKRLSGVTVYEIQQDPGVPDVWWAATGSGIYKSIDDAETWTLQTASGLPSGSTGRTELAIAPSNGNVVYALFQSGASSSAELWRTTDGGASWTQRSTGSNACDGQCSYNMTLAVDVTNPDVVYRGTVQIFRSTDGGANWTNLIGGWGPSQKVHQDTHVVLTVPGSPGLLWIGTDGGVWRSTDGGSSFTNRAGNMNLTQFYWVGVDPNDPERICGGAQDNGSLARAGSDVWQLQAATGDGFVCAFNGVDTQYVYAASYPGTYPNVIRSSTGLYGSYFTITGAGSGIAASDRENWVTPYVLDPQDPKTMYLGTQRVYRSTNYGTSWTPVGPNDLTSRFGTLVTIEVNRQFPAVIFTGSNSGRVWRSQDAGANFTDLSAGLPLRSINDVGADPSDPNRAFAVLSGFGTAHLWEWTSSTGWTARGAGLPDVPANTVLLRSSSEVFVGNDVGVFRSTDGGVSFVPFMDGLPEGVVVTDLKYDVSRELLTAGTYGRGAWQISLATPLVDPGSVGDGLALALLPGGDLRATWPLSCNDGELSGQTYSIQEGDLDALRAGGGYDHAPVAGDCARVSPSTFTPAAGNRYYLVVPNEGGREGGAGDDSTGLPRPQTSLVCGARQAASCP